MHFVTLETTHTTMKSSSHISIGTKQHPRFFPLHESIIRVYSAVTTNTKKLGLIHHIVSDDKALID